MKVCPSAFNGENTKALKTRKTSARLWKGRFGATFILPLRPCILVSGFAANPDLAPAIRATCSIMLLLLMKVSQSPVRKLINRLVRAIYVKSPRKLTQHEMVRYKVTQCIQMS
ncbi:MAG: hypothetical protein DKT66_09195 [Candidatus Melainabacteria bacterium]|nr:MAG: hypothetical protein DKT66_09195 [Candidatus Melainabacteria bacterium]